MKWKLVLSWLSRKSWLLWITKSFNTMSQELKVILGLSSLWLAEFCAVLRTHFVLDYVFQHTLELIALHLKLIYYKFIVIASYLVAVLRPPGRYSWNVLIDVASFAMMRTLHPPTPVPGSCGGCRSGRRPWRLSLFVDCECLITVF